MIKELEDITEDQLREVYERMPDVQNSMSFEEVLETDFMCLSLARQVSSGGTVELEKIPREPRKLPTPPWGYCHLREEDVRKIYQQLHGIRMFLFHGTGLGGSREDALLAVEQAMTKIATKTRVRKLK